MQSRILFSSSTDNLEHTLELLLDVGVGDVGVVDVTKDEGEEQGFLFLLDSPSARTQERFIPAFSQAANLQNWQFLRVFSVMVQAPPLLHL